MADNRPLNRSRLPIKPTLESERLARVDCSIPRVRYWTGMFPTCFTTAPNHFLCVEAILESKIDYPETFHAVMTTYTWLKF
ncbi:hypothetical protein KC333_g179 [Hortaea werneckii]|nr:hypothetical protein KC333_g179 [Hortaea werneckii]